MNCTMMQKHVTVFFGRALPRRVSTASIIPQPGVLNHAYRFRQSCALSNLSCIQLHRIRSTIQPLRYFSTEHADHSTYVVNRVAHNFERFSAMSPQKRQKLFPSMMQIRPKHRPQMYTPHPKPQLSSVDIAGDVSLTAFIQMEMRLVCVLDCIGVFFFFFFFFFFFSVIV
jgi:hypothetical protein